MSVNSVCCGHAAGTQEGVHCLHSGQTLYRVAWFLSAALVALPVARAAERPEWWKATVVSPAAGPDFASALAASLAATGDAAQEPRARAKLLELLLDRYPPTAPALDARVDLAKLYRELGEVDWALHHAQIVLEARQATPAAQAAARDLIAGLLPARLATAQTWNLFTKEELQDGCIPVQLALGNHTPTVRRVRIEWRVTDLWGQPQQAPKGQRVEVAPEAEVRQTALVAMAEQGAYLVEAQLDWGAVQVTESAVVSLIPPAHPGLRPDSFFASNTSGEGHVATCAKIGLKVMRMHFASPELVLKTVPERPGDPFELDFSRLEALLTEREAAGISILPIVGYAYPLRSPEAVRLGQHGPPRDFAEFVKITVPIVEHFAQLKRWEFWNEPWIYGWTWAASAAQYRELQKMWVVAAKAVRPDIEVLAGESASFFVDNIRPDPAAVRSMDALTNHPYKDGNQPTWRSGAQQRYMDYGIQEARREGIRRCLVTENGTEVSRGQTGLTAGQRQDAAKLVTLHALMALSGCYQGNVQEGIGWGAEYPWSNAAYAVMTNLLEDRPLVADVWPAQPLIWGAVFANPKCVTDEVRALPRAADIGTRWDVPVPADRADDATKVAMIWSYTGPDAETLDPSGTLTIGEAGGIRALDLMGAPTGVRLGPQLIVPFGPSPVYLLSDQLSVAELRRRIAEATIEHVTAVNATISALPAPPNESPGVTVRVQNQLNRVVSGTVTLQGPDRWTFEPPSRWLRLDPAEVADLEFRHVLGPRADDSLYPLTVLVRTDAGHTRTRQVVTTAAVRRLTPVVDGKLDEWPGIPAGRLDSRLVTQRRDFAEYLLNPQLAPLPPTSEAHVVVDSRVAYDRDNVYVAFAVQEPGSSNSSDGDPSGVSNLPTSCGDCFELAFGFGRRSDDDYRPPTDPWFWKGCVRDADYELLLFRNSKGQPVLLSAFRPGQRWRVDFQTEQVNVDVVPDAQVRIGRDEAAQVTTYEAAIPRAYLQRFQPLMRTMRFGFVYFNDEQLPPLEWSRACGVFDYLNNNGSYLPTWMNFLPCQTPWRIEQ